MSAQESVRGLEKCHDEGFHDALSLKEAETVVALLSRQDVVMESPVDAPVLTTTKPSRT